MNTELSQMSKGKMFPFSSCTSNKQTVVTSAHILLYQDKESVSFIFVSLQTLTAKQINT